MKKLIILFLVVAIAGLFLAKDIIVKVALERYVEAISGLRISEGSIDVGLIKASIRVKDLVILNPEDFSDPVMFDINELYVDYDILSVFKKDIHLEDMVFDLKQLNVIRNDKGKLNLDSVKIIKRLSAKKRYDGPTNGSMPRIMIDKLRLKGGKVVYKNYLKAPAAITEFSINIDERYENIDDPYSLVSLIVSRSLVKTNPYNVIGFDITPLQNQLHGVVTNSVGTLKNTTKSLKKVLNLAK